MNHINSSETTVQADRLWGIGRVAQRLDCCQRSVYNRIAEGLPYIKLGRLIKFIPEDVEKFILERRVG